MTLPLSPCAMMVRGRSSGAPGARMPLRWIAPMALELVLGIAACDAAPIATPSDLQVQHYELDVSFDPDTAAVSGTVVLTLSWQRASPRQIAVDMAEPLSANGLSVDGRHAGYVHTGAKLIVTLPSALPARHPHMLRISYAGKPSPRYLHFHAMAGSPAIASYGLPYSAMQWWPTLDQPGLKAAGADIVITAPRGTMAVSNGALIGVDRLPDGSSRFHWHESSPIYADVVSVAIGRYEVISGEYRSASGRRVPLRYYVYPSDGPEAEEEFATVPQVLRLYESLFGPYPFAQEKYGIAEVPFPSFREHQTVPSLGRDLILGTAPVWDLREVGNVIAHDMAHQWFGDSLTPRTWSDVWLNEAFANYAVALWHERRSGEADYRRFMRSLDTGRFPGAVYISPDRPRDELLTYTTFNKGAWVLHMLRHVMGDRRFFVALHDYVDANRSGAVDTAAWRAACERAYGKPLGWFFDEWVYGEGRPALRTSWDASSRSWDLRVRIDQVQPGRVFVMPVDLEWTAAGRSVRRTVWLRRRHEQLTLRAGAPISKVILDPDGWLLEN
jgi:aminopeptidase N